MSQRPRILVPTVLLAAGLGFASIFLAACFQPASPSSSPPPPPATAAALHLNELVFPNWTNYAAGYEIYNPGTVAVDLSTYQLRTKARTNDGSGNPPDHGVETFALPSVQVPAGGYVVIRSAINPDYVSGGQTVYLDDGQATPHFPWISYSGGFAELIKAGETTDFVNWGSDTNSPTSAGFVFSGPAPQPYTSGSQAYVGYSIARDAAGTDTASGTDWTAHAWNTLGGKNDVTTDSASDGDGIPDSAKALGSTFAGLPLYAWGARSGQKDIFIHLDYMDSSQDVSGSSADLAMTPTKAALDAVVAAFLVHGIHIHFDVGDLFSATAGDFANYNLDGRSHKVPWVQSITLGKSTGFANTYAYKVTYMPVAKRQVFFYMLFGSSQVSDGSGGSSGLASINGNTALISFGRWNVSNSNTIVDYQASTIMHEFGHNLGLLHGGDENTNYKPNYFSIMNYLYQLSGLPKVGNEDTRYYDQFQGTLSGTWTTKANSTLWFDGPTHAIGPWTTVDAFHIDYSTGVGSIMDETSISDSFGIGRAGTVGIDFANDGSLLETNQSLDILGSLSGTVTAKSSLHDFDDWTKISSVFQRQYSGFNSGATQNAAPSLSQSSAVADPKAIFNAENSAISEPCAPMPRP